MRGTDVRRPLIGECAVGILKCEQRIDREFEISSPRSIQIESRRKSIRQGNPRRQSSQGVISIRCKGVHVRAQATRSTKSVVGKHPRQLKKTAILKEIKITVIIQGNCRLEERAIFIAHLATIPVEKIISRLYILTRDAIGKLPASDRPIDVDTKLVFHFIGIHS